MDKYTVNTADLLDYAIMLVHEYAEAHGLTDAQAFRYMWRGPSKIFWMLIVLPILCLQMMFVIRSVGFADQEEVCCHETRDATKQITAARPVTPVTAVTPHVCM